MSEPWKLDEPELDAGLLALSDVGQSAGELRQQSKWILPLGLRDADDDATAAVSEDGEVKRLDLIDDASSGGGRKKTTTATSLPGQKRMQRQSKARILSDLLRDDDASDNRMRRRADAVQASGSVHKMRRISDEVKFNFEVDLCGMMEQAASTSMGRGSTRRRQQERSARFSTVQNRQRRYVNSNGGGKIDNAKWSASRAGGARAAAGAPPETIQRDEWGVPLLNAFQPPFHRLPAPLSCEIVEPFTVFPHQIRGIEFAQHCENNPHRGVSGSMLCMEMGLGKSLTSLMLLVLDKVNNRMSGPCLLVCPVSLINSWITDTIHKFFHDRLRIMVFRKEYLNGHWTTLSEETLRGFDIVITNYETISAAAKEYTASKKPPKSKMPSMLIDNEAAAASNAAVTGARLLFHIEWHRIIADESQRFTNPKSICFKSMCGLRARHRMCLTGTPYRNYDRDLWAQFYWLGYRDTPHTKNWDRSRFEEHKMHRCILLMNEEDAQIQLPPKRTRRYDLHLDGKGLQIYLLFKTIILLKATKSPCDALTVLLLLRQLCLAPFLISPEAGSRLTGKAGAAEGRLAEFKNCAEYASFDPALRAIGALSPVLATLGGLCTRAEYLGALSRVVKNANADANADANANAAASTEVVAAELDAWLTDIHGTAGIGSAKMVAAIDLLQHQIPAGEKVIVFSSFEKAIRLLQKSLIFHGVHPDRVLVVTGRVDRSERAELFNRFRTQDTCQFLLMTYGVGSVGLNLQEAQHVVHFEPWWNTLNERQGTKRSHRIGQTKEVNEWYILIKDSIEDKIRERCLEKEKKSQAMLGGAHVSAESASSPPPPLPSEDGQENEDEGSSSSNSRFELRLPSAAPPPRSEKETNIAWLHDLMDEDGE